MHASRVCKLTGLSFLTLAGWNVARLLLYDPRNIHKKCCFDHHQKKTDLSFLFQFFVVVVVVVVVCLGNKEHNTYLRGIQVSLTFLLSKPGSVCLVWALFCR